MTDLEFQDVHLRGIKLPPHLALIDAATLERIAALLERVEWNAGDTANEPGGCPDCYCVQEYTDHNFQPPRALGGVHAPDCELAALRAVLAGLLEGT